MMRLIDGNYKTLHNSTVTLSKNGGVTNVAFDWFEEPQACIECEVNPYPDGNMLTWGCDYCGGGSAQLYAEKFDFNNLGCI